MICGDKLLKKLIVTKINIVPERQLQIRFQPVKVMNISLEKYPIEAIRPEGSMYYQRALPLSFQSDAIPGVGLIFRYRFR